MAKKTKNQTAAAKAEINRVLARGPGANKRGPKPGSKPKTK